MKFVETKRFSLHGSSEK